MENKFQFSTNIKCEGCVASVKPHLDGEEGITEWNVNTGSNEKVLTVVSGGITAEEVQNVIRKAGFEATVINQ